MFDQRARILPPYTRRVNDTRHLISKVAVVTLLILFAMTMGFFIAIFGLRGWFIPTVPIILMFGAALWMAPDIDGHYDKAIERGFFIFMAISLIWPGYLAFNFSGLPWITFERFAMFILAAISIFHFSTSRRFRSEVKETLTSNIWLFRLFFGWVTISILMSGFSLFSNISRDINIQIMWHLPLVLSAWVMRFDGNPQRLLKIVIIYILITSAVVIPESQQEMVIWAPYIPQWFVAEEQFWGMILEGSRRFDEYRAKSIYLVAVAYAEFIGMSVPFILFAIFHAKSFWRGALAFALFALLFTAAYFTNSRTAMAVFVATIPAFVFLWAVRRYRLQKSQQDLISTAILWAYPAMAMAVAFAVISISRIRVRVLGGSGTQNSDNARAEQWDMAIPQILQNPIGYGSGTVSQRVPYTNLAGDFTIDSYPINLLIQYGVVGFLLFAGFFILAVIVGARCYVMAKNRDELVAGAAALSIFSFLISRTILSMEAGIPWAFVSAGVIMGIHWRQTQHAESSRSPVRTTTPGLQRTFS